MFQMGYPSRFSKPSLLQENRGEKEKFGWLARPSMFKLSFIYGVAAVAS